MERLETAEADFNKKTSTINDIQKLTGIRNEFLSKNGFIAKLMQNLKNLSIEEKKTFGAKVNEFKKRAEKVVSDLEIELKSKKIEESLKSECLDITIPVSDSRHGLLHPMTKVIRELSVIFQSMGFSIAEGPEIEDDWHCFEALNVLQDHPARQMQDTFYMPDGSDGKKYVLRTQTTSVEIREMTSDKPPFKIVSMGKTYRVDYDATHLPMFQQIDGLYIDVGITMANLKSTLSSFLKKFFEIEAAPIRFRPSYFPFTSPSVELDMKCTKEGGKIVKFGEGNDWCELCGAGMTHPNVLKNVGLDPNHYQGFAFGFGIERLAMLKYGIGDMRYLYGGDLRFLEHYSFRFFES